MLKKKKKKERKKYHMWFLFSQMDTNQYSKGRSITPGTSCTISVTHRNTLLHIVIANSIIPLLYNSKLKNESDFKN